MAVAPTLATTGGLPYRIVGNQRETQTDVQFDNSYQEGGEPLTPAQLGLNVVHSAICQLRLGPEAEEFVSGAWYSPSEEKIHLNNDKTGKEVEGTKNMSKVNVRVIARGW